MKLEAPFAIDFTLDGKAVEAADGGLIVEGYASNFDFDRQDEAFEPGAFTKGMERFMATNPVLLYHHHPDQALGRVLEWAVKSAGLWIKAHLDKPEPGTPLADVFRKVASGTIKGFSVGGIFKRRQDSEGRTRIHDADFAEISVTPLPINGTTTISAVYQKAFSEEPPSVDTKALTDLADRLEKLVDTLLVLDKKADTSKAGRERAAKTGHALPDGSFPIYTAKDVHDAFQLLGRYKGDQGKAKAHITKWAKRLGVSLPDSWKGN